nr:hypothetical protein [Sedimentibacter sp.]
MNNLDSNNKVNWMNCFSVAAVWFGTHVGGGFAMGTQTVNFYSKYGWTALIMPAMAMLLLGIVFYYAYNFARLTKTYDYRGYIEKFYHPYDKFFATILDIAFIVFMCVPVGASLAGGATVLQTTFGVPYLLGAVIITAVFFISAIFGVKFIAKLSTVLTVVILITLLSIAFLGINLHFGQISEILANQKISEGFSFKDAFINVFVYAAFQASIAPMISVAGIIKNKKEVKATAAMGIIINATALTIMAVLLLGWLPDIIKNPLPVLTVVKELNKPILFWFYVIALLAAYLSTASTFLFAVGLRYKNAKFFNKLSKENIFNKKPEIRTYVVIFLSLVYCLIVSLGGLMPIILIGQKAMGYSYLFLIIIPHLIIGPKKCRALELKEDKTKQTSAEEAAY